MNISDKKQEFFAKLLNEYREQTSSMTKERYGYLVRHFNFARGFIADKLQSYKEQGASEELLCRIEYKYLFGYFEKTQLLKWQLDKQDVALRDYAVSALIEKAEEETKYYSEMLEEYRIYYGSRIMTQERYNYLVNRYKLYSKYLDRRLQVYKDSGLDSELIMRIKFYKLFNKFSDSRSRLWEKLEWGIKENECLAGFSEGALMNLSKQYAKTGKMK